MSSELIAAVQPKLFMSLICALNMVPCWLLRRDLSGGAVRMLNEATLFFGIGLPLLLFKDWLPRIPTVIVGNMLVLAAMTLLWQVASGLSGRRTDRRLVLVAPLAWALCWLFPPFRAELDLRIAVAAGLSGLLIGLPVIDLLRMGASGMPGRLLAATGLLHIALSVVRTVLAARHDRFAGDPIWTTITQLNTLAYMMLWPALCTVLLNRRSLEAEAERGRRDELSGLLNRRGVLFEIARAGPGVILLFDIDHFKRINDRFGHASGDATIVAFARVARQVLGHDLPLGRIGGEEFVALIPAGQVACGRLRAETDAVRIADEVRRTFAAHRLPSGINATVSVGVAPELPGGSSEEQLARADRALYRAKHLGRNRIELCGGQEETGQTAAPPTCIHPASPVSESIRVALEAA